MRKLLSTLLALIIVLTAVPGLFLSASAESLYIRKIVSVVYDDSGSMAGDKWAYANYATQAFCGMLNSEDQLFITYMSAYKNYADKNPNQKYDPPKIDLSAGGIQGSVNSIRNHKDSGWTPFGAVKAAYEKLSSVNDSNPNTQYWLVVVTDGEFDEYKSLSAANAKKELNKEFKAYAESVMPNGTKPQITFLGIGQVASPDEDQSKGIYTYGASNASGIVGAMSDMADRISGRTRLGKSDLKKTDDRTIQVSSSIPLLNIAVFAQGTKAGIVKANHGNEKSIPVSRSASLEYPGYSDLVGNAYLLGDSQNVIGSGTYNITFDQKVDLEDVVVLFEPALETRMTISLNGKEVSDYSELENSMEKDKISASFKIYEMGTNTEVDPALLPPGTKFEISVSEGGKVVERSSGKEMKLSDYELKNVETVVTAAVIIEGFNPIEYSAEFTPAKYVPKVDYSIVPSFENGVKSVKFDNIAANKDMTVSFTVYADGVAMTDPEMVKALNPVIEVSPQGNDGSVTYAADGKIVFTPNAASTPAAGAESFDVRVSCTIEDGTSASEVYTVLIADYQVIPVGTNDTVKKTGFYDNRVSVSFYITKDGVKLDKKAVEKNISVVLNESQSHLKIDISVADDGTITVTPYTDEEHNLTFWNWWINWAYYFGLEGDDVAVTLSHSYGTASATIDVVEETLSYQILNVYLPLIIELIALAFLIAWIVLVVTKPRYLKSAMFFVGEIKYNRDRGTHTVRNFNKVRLEKFNAIKKGNGRLKFKKTADIVSANGIKIRADRDGKIICEMPFPWYRSKVEPVDSDLANLRMPEELSEYVMRHKRLEIKEFATTETVEGEYQRCLVPANPRIAKYIVVPDQANGVSVIDNRRVIRSGKLFVYIND